MRKSSLALKTEFITSQEIETFEATRESYYAFKKRCEDLEAQMKQMESALIVKVESQVDVDPSFALTIKISERRYPHYKAALADALGIDHVQRVILEPCAKNYLNSSNPFVELMTRHRASV